MMPDISVIEILCDKQFAHISSSGIRDIVKLEDNLNKGKSGQDMIFYSSKYMNF